MKKTALVLALTALFAVSAFAGLTTYTKEMALTAGSNLFGVLTPGSLSSVRYLATDLNLIGNAVDLEYSDGGANVFASVITGMGIVGISIDDENVLNIAYSTTGDDMRLGGSLIVGWDGNSYENKQVVDNPNNPDRTTNNEMNMGAVFNIDMPKAGMTFMGYLGVYGEYDITRDFDNTANVLITSEDDAETDWTFMAVARLNPGGFNVIPVIGYMLDTSVDRDWADINMDGTLEIDTVTTYSSSYYLGGIFAGRDFNVTDIITVKGGAALIVTGRPGETTKTEDRVADTLVYNGSRSTGYYVNVPMYVGVEAKLNDTWSLYTSAGTEGLSMNGNTDQFNQEISSASFTDYQVNGDLSVTPNVYYAIGANMTVGDFKLDVCFDPSIFTSGTYAITGNSTDSNDLVYRIAVSYGWK
ncbi:MAG: hypothetical protein LLG37_06880 [Spirochaetia bacterium]|nr:hypothetical protein [Spirochaetia bacterium]